MYAGLGLSAVWIIENLGPERFFFLFKCIFASNILWNISIMAIKVGVSQMKQYFGD